MTQIRNMRDLAKMLNASAPTKEAIKHQVYKYTNCGAWIEIDKTGVLIGSIVEGADFGTATYRLKYPFTEADYRAREEAVETEASAIWEWANTGPETTKTYADLGQDAPDIDRDYLHLNPEGRSS